MHPCQRWGGASSVPRRPGRSRPALTRGSSSQAGDLCFHGNGLQSRRPQPASPWRTRGCRACPAARPKRERTPRTEQAPSDRTGPRAGRVVPTLADTWDVREPEVHLEMLHLGLETNATCVTSGEGLEHMSGDEGARRESTSSRRTSSHRRSDLVRSHRRAARPRDHLSAG